MKRLDTLLVALLASLLLLAPLTAEAQDEEEAPDGYAMNDVRATVHLPDKWEPLPGGWSDWDFKAKNKDGSIEMRLWYTDFQVESTEAHAEGWVKMHTVRLNKHKAGDVQSTRTEVTERFGRSTLEMDLSFQFDGDGPKGVYQAVAFPAYAKVIHIAMMSNERNAPKAKAAMDHFLETIEIHKGAEDLSGLYGKAQPGAYGKDDERPHFENTLPDGWRIYAASEVGPMAELVKKTGQGKLDKNLCWAAFKPTAGTTDPDVMVFCEGGLVLDKVDEYSWSGIEPTVRGKFFGGSSIEVEPAEKFVVGDRLGFLYHPPSRGSENLMAVAPYETGTVMVGWARAGSKESSVSDAFADVLASTRYTGLNGGEQPIGGLGGWFVYSIRYRPTNPLFIGPVVMTFLAFFGILVLLARHRPKELEDY